jgi:hypothetical protein
MEIVFKHLKEIFICPLGGDNVGEKTDSVSVEDLFAYYSVHNYCTPNKLLPPA